MVVRHQGVKYTIKSGSPYHAAILKLAKAAEEESSTTAALPERNDVKQLWRELKPGHQEFLYQVARRPGLSQGDLEALLGVNSEGLRGVHNGVTRIIDGRGYERLVRTIGYNSENRRYTMDDDVAKTVLNLTQRQ